MIFLDKSKAFLENHVKESPEKPFFLFHSTQGVHLPSFPGKDFKGKTNAGPHGDFIYEFDYVVGELLDTLDRLGMAENTLVMVTSDNGPEVTSVVNMRKDYEHDGARPWRGMKRDQWEGGHRVPLVARWPEKVPAGSRSDQTVCLCDIMATCAGVVGVQLPNNAAEDSFDILPAMFDEQNEDEVVRSHTLHQTIRLDLAIRRGKWKYLDHQGSGGNDYEKDALKPYALPETEPDAPGQLYDLEVDAGETTNLYFKYPGIVEELKSLLHGFRDSGRSVPPRDSH